MHLYKTCLGPFCFLALSVRIPFRPTPEPQLFKSCSSLSSCVWPVPGPQGPVAQSGNTWLDLDTRARQLPLNQPAPGAWPALCLSTCWTPGEGPLILAPDKPSVPIMASTIHSRMAITSSHKFRLILTPSCTSFHFQWRSALSTAFVPSTATPLPGGCREPVTWVSFPVCSGAGMLVDLEHHWPHVHAQLTVINANVHKLSHSHCPVFPLVHWPQLIHTC